MWSSPDKPINDSFSWKKFHLSILLKYELEFAPTKEVKEAIRFLRPLSYKVVLYQDALKENDPEALERAKGELRRVFAKYV